MADVVDPGDGRVVVGVYEVDMIGRPADHEDENNHCEHQHHLAVALLAKVKTVGPHPHTSIDRGKYILPTFPDDKMQTSRLTQETFVVKSEDYVAGCLLVLSTPL